MAQIHGRKIPLVSNISFQVLLMLIRLRYVQCVMSVVEGGLKVQLCNRATI